MIPVHFRGLLAAYYVCLYVLSTKKNLLLPVVGNPRVSQLSMVETRETREPGKLSNLSSVPGGKFPLVQIYIMT